MNCCCRWGAAVSGEWPEFECYACPVHKAALATPFELCKRHKRVKEADNKIVTDDGRTLNYGYAFSEDDPQLKLAQKINRGDGWAEDLANVVYFSKLKEI